jgi:hypothetical protein
MVSMQPIKVRKSKVHPRTGATSYLAERVWAWHRLEALAILKGEASSGSRFLFGKQQLGTAVRLGR